MGKWGKSYCHKTEAFSSTEHWQNDAQRLIKHMHLVPSVLLDVGCNKGRFLSMIGEVHRHAYLMGVDVNQYAIDNPHSMSWELATKVGDLSRKVDTVVCMHALPQFEQPFFMLSDIWNGMVSGGQIQLICHNKYNDYRFALKNKITGYQHDETITKNYSLRDVRWLMKDAGFIEDKLYTYYYNDDDLLSKIPLLHPRIHYVGRKP